MRQDDVTATETRCVSGEETPKERIHYLHPRGQGVRIARTFRMSPRWLQRGPASVSPSVSSSPQAVEYAVDKETHGLFRRAVGRLLWNVFGQSSPAPSRTRPGPRPKTYGILQDTKILKRYIKTASTSKWHVDLPPHSLQSSQETHLRVYVDAKRAGIPSMRKNTTGTLLPLFGCLIHFVPKTPLCGCGAFRRELVVHVRGMGLEKHVLYEHYCFISSF